MPANRPPNKKANCFTLRVHDNKTLEIINELIAKLGGNRNAVLNDIIRLGAPELYARVFGDEVRLKQSAETAKAAYSPNVGRELKKLRKDMDDVFVQMVSIETMVAGLFNAKTDELEGDEVNAESLLDGSLCELPELVAGLKADLTRTGAERDEQ